MSRVLPWTKKKHALSHERAKPRIAETVYRRANAKFPDESEARYTAEMVLLAK